MRIKAIALLLIAALVLIPASVAVGNLLLSNGLTVDDNNRVIAINGGTIAYLTSLGFPVDATGALVIACQSGCSGGGGTPGGSDTQVQFNDASAFGGDAGMTYNKTTDTLTVGTLVSGAGTTGAWQASEGSDPSLCAASKDTLWADSTNHAWRSCLNNGSSEFVAQSTAVRPADATKYLDGSGAWTSPAGTGLAASMYIFGIGTSAVSGGFATNATRLWAITNPVAITGSTKFGYDVQTADNSGNLYDIGIYNSAGTLICHTGATAGTTLAPSTGVKVGSWTASCNIPGGDLYIGTTGNAATFILGGQTNTFAAVCVAAATTNNTTSGGALNSSVGIPTRALASCTLPMFAASTL